jgi:hypothetical protein
VEGRGRWSFKNVFHDDDIASIAPWVLWSEVGGSVTNTDTQTFAPGRYIDAGASLEYDKNINDTLTLALSVAASARHYAVDQNANGQNRQDYKVSPGAALIFNGVFGPQTDFRLSYRFDRNWSNDDAHSYDAHTVMASMVFRR